MRQYSDDLLMELIADQRGPCVSLYQPAHRHHPGAAQDPIRYRNLLKEAEGSLRQKYGSRETRALLEVLRSYARDRPFWDHQLDGLAAFATPHSFHLVQLQRPALGGRRGGVRCLR